ncbi:hypothetical protein [Desulfopila inferna]|uniref:hypothetical protein n=1 Tax=Desulfopila inferna TaxID=468528 RepID=UPI00196698D7|nr:hypothetical protein [Desulfopila inferna]MBM9604260.1 hypothetical protein [Desulfopila inferna]
MLVDSIVDSIYGVAISALRQSPISSVAGFWAGLDLLPGIAKDLPVKYSAWYVELFSSHFRELW